MEGEIENWTAKAEAWRRHADLSRTRAAIVRKVAVMMRGTEPLPDGLTRAALVVCGTAWRGFEWVRRGVEVSPAVWKVERNAAADKLALYAGEVAREAGKVSDAFHAADALAALRGESLTPPAEWTSPALERLRPIRDAVAGTLDALNEEGEAWRDFEAAYLEAVEAVPVKEIEAARARLAAEDTALDSDAKGMALREAQTAAFKAWREFVHKGKIKMPRKMASRLSMFKNWGDTNGRINWGQVVQSVKLLRFKQMWESYRRRH